jgi:hypothetical protein
MTTKKALVLDEQGVELIHSIAEDYLRRRHNPPVRDQKDWFYKTQDVYVALVPDAGIPATNVYLVGSALCYIYQITNNIPAGLVPIGGNHKELVYNLNLFPICSDHQSSTGTGTSGTPSFIPIVRDKFGKWLACRFPIPALAKMQFAGTSGPAFGVLPTDKYHLWLGTEITSISGVHNSFDTNIVLNQVSSMVCYDDGSGFAWIGFNPDGYAHVIQANHYANIIWGTLGGSLSSMGTVSCNVGGSADGISPGSTVMVSDAQGMFGTYPVSSGTNFTAYRVPGTTIGGYSSYNFQTIQC